MTKPIRLKPQHLCTGIVICGYAACGCGHAHSHEWGHTCGVPTYTYADGIKIRCIPLKKGAKHE